MIYIDIFIIISTHGLKKVWMGPIRKAFYDPLEAGLLCKYDHLNIVISKILVG